MSGDEPWAGWPALVRLARFKRRARWRRLRADLRRPARAALMLAALGFLALVVWRQFSAPAAPDESARFLGAGLTTFIAVSLWSAARSGSIHFTPEEVHFLFPAPIGTRALIFSHVRTQLLRSLGGACFLALFLRGGGMSLTRGALMYALLFGTLVLLATAVDLRCMGLTTERRRRLGLVTGVALVALLGGLAGSAALSSGGDWRAAVDGYALPGRPFALVGAARAPGPLLAALGGVLAFDALLLASILRFRGDLREAAHATSRKVQQMLERMGSNTPLADGAPRERHRSLPRLPYLHGAGPHAWRQLLALTRTRKSFVMLFLMTGVMAGTMAVNAERVVPEVAAASILAMLSFAGPIYVTSDFRSDWGALPWLRSLPCPAGRLALGQLLGATIVLTLLQWVAAGWVLFVVAPERLALWIGALAAVPAFTLLQLAVENGTFLIFPVRVARAGQAAVGFGAIARLYLLMGLKLLVLLVALAPPAALGAAAWFATRSLGAVALVGVTTLYAMTAGCVWLVGRILLRIDPSRTPS